MKLAVIGAGKLGMPHALALDYAGHQVWCYDTSEQVREHFLARTWPHVEKGVPPLLKSHKLKWLDNPSEFDGDLAFIAVQTPHDQRFDGTKPVAGAPQDFDYSYLEEALGMIHVPPVVISTVLPGTWKRLFPFIEGYIYNPSFIAMGTVLQDLQRAEFNLIGAEARTPAVEKLVEVWRTVNDAPIFECGVTEAEAIKVAYNSYISMKISLANTWGWLGEQVGFNAATVMNALSLADRRLISRAYLAPGMGDGGGCHPRDLIALSWLAREHGVHDLFGSLMAQREQHAWWLASLLPDGVVMFGTAFKPDTKIADGSPALLVANALWRQGKSYTIGEDPKPGMFNFIATAHARYQDILWPAGSVVVDPHGLIEKQLGVEVRRPGR